MEAELQEKNGAIAGLHEKIKREQDHFEEVLLKKEGESQWRLAEAVAEAA